MAQGTPRTLGLTSLLGGNIVVPFLVGCTGGGQCGGSADCQPASPPCPFLDGGAFESVAPAPECTSLVDFYCYGMAPVVCPGGQLSPVVPHGRAPPMTIPEHDRRPARGPGRAGILGGCSLPYIDNDRAVDESEIGVDSERGRV